MVVAKPTKHSLPSFIYDAPDRDIFTLLKALCAEYFCMTCFLFFTIGTVKLRPLRLLKGFGKQEKGSLGLPKRWARL